MSDKSSKLTEKHLRAIVMLADGVAYHAIASVLGVTTRTIERWAVRSDIRYSVDQARAKALETVEEEVCEKYKRAIEGMIPLALTTLHKTLKDTSARNSDKLRAVQILGKWYGLEKSPVFVKAENGTEPPEALLKQYLGAIGGNENGSRTSSNN